MGGGTPSYDQDSFRFRNDDGSETTATWVAALNTDATLGVDTTYRIRLLLQNVGTAAGANVDWDWQYNLGGAGWNNITTASSVVRAVSSANFANGADCTQQLGSGTFFANNDGMTQDGTAGGANLDLPNGQECESEVSFQILSGDVADGNTIQFRVTRDGGTLLNTYTRTPQATVTEVTPPSDVVGTDSGTLSEQSATLGDVTRTENATLSEALAGIADVAAPDSGTLAEAISGTVDVVAPDSAVLAESPLGLLDTLATDTHTLADTGLGDALASGVDSATLSDTGIGELGVPRDDVVGVDAAVLSEIEALLAEVSTVEALAFTDTWNAPPVPEVVSPDVRVAGEGGTIWLTPDVVPDEDEVLVLAGYVNWYH